MGNSKSKGSGYEREVAKFLSKWIQGTEKPYLFWRMPSSGALATLSDNNKMLSGDIIAVHKDGVFFTDFFSIECKTGYLHADLWKVFKNSKRNDIKEFWLQASYDALKASKHPILFFKKKGYKSIVGISPTIVEIFDISNIPSIYITFNDNIEIVFFDMLILFKHLTPQIMRNKIKELNIHV